MLQDQIPNLDGKTSILSQENASCIICICISYAASCYYNSQSLLVIDLCFVYLLLLQRSMPTPFKFITIMYASMYSKVQLAIYYSYYHEVSLNSHITCLTYICVKFHMSLPNFCKYYFLTPHVHSSKISKVMQIIIIIRTIIM